MTETAGNTTGSLPAVRSVALVGDEPARRDWAAELVGQARAEGFELTGDNGLLPDGGTRTSTALSRLGGAAVRRARQTRR